MMVRGVCMASRCTAVLIAALLSSYWAWFALTSFPWIVPPDNSGAYVTAYQYAALAGALLTVVSCGSIVVATGVWGRTRCGWIAAVVLLSASALASAGLYPALPAMDLSPLRLPAQVVGVVVVILGTMVFRAPRVVPPVSDA